ncbi:MAG: carbohydrate-binding family 9-like protein [Ignavibacteriaceae bacterium]
MKNKELYFYHIVVIPLIVAVNLKAQEKVFPVPKISYNPEHYICYKTDSDILIDGYLTEDNWLAARWSDSFTDIEGSPKDKPGLDTKVKMLWDDLYFYVGARLQEPHIWATLKQRDTVIYQDNDFEIFIDPDWDTHNYYEIELNAFNTVWDLLLLKPYRDGGLAVNAWDITGLKTAVSFQGTLNDPSDTDTAWFVEIAIPWNILKECSGVPSPPENNDLWKINFSRVQWQTEIMDRKYVKLQQATKSNPHPESNWVWSPQGIIAMHYPEMWGVVQFSDKYVGTKPEFEKQFEHESAYWYLRKLYYRQKNFYLKNGYYADDPGILQLQEYVLPGYKFPVRLDAARSSYEATLFSPEGDFYISIFEDGKIVLIKSTQIR